jgi:hypothetical protein
MLKLAALINTICIGLSVALIYFPASAIYAMTKEAEQPFFQRLAIEELAPHLIGPITALLSSVILRFFLARRLQIPKWLIITGAIGAVYSITALRGGYAHDFSHYVCDACSGYGTIILTISSSTAILLALTFVARSWHKQSSESVALGS